MADQTTNETFGPVGPERKELNFAVSVQEGGAKKNEKKC